MADISFHHAAPILSVRDLELSLDFYARLGFTLCARYDGYALLACECILIHLRVDRTLDPLTNSSGAYFYLQGVDAFAEAMTAELIPLLEPPSDRAWYMRECTLADPDGNFLRFGENLPTDLHPGPDAPPQL